MSTTSHSLTVSVIHALRGMQHRRKHCREDGAAVFSFVLPFFHFFLVGVNSPDAWQTEAAVTHRVRPSTVKSQKGEHVPL